MQMRNERQTRNMSLRQRDEGCRQRACTHEGERGQGTREDGSHVVELLAIYGTGGGGTGEGSWEQARACAVREGVLSELPAVQGGASNYAKRPAAKKKERRNQATFPHIPNRANSGYRCTRNHATDPTMTRRLPQRAAWYASWAVHRLRAGLLPWGPAGASGCCAAAQTKRGGARALSARSWRGAAAGCSCTRRGASPRARPPARAPGRGCVVASRWLGP